MVREELGIRLKSARDKTDEIFRLVSREALHDRPIAERHRLIFYLGHVEAFDFNMVCRTAFDCASRNEPFDRLFAFGIDPTNGQLPSDSPSDWPAVEEIVAYNRQARLAVDSCLERTGLADSDQPFVEGGMIFHVSIEHRLMHAETLTYLLNQLPAEHKLRGPAARTEIGRRVVPRLIEIPGGRVTLGLEAGGAGQFGWDNEYQAHEVDVPGFAIDAYDVTNNDYLEFVQAGGYRDRGLWSEDDWRWLNLNLIRHPAFWVSRGQAWTYRTLFGEIPMPGGWPVYVSHAEAAAYARWQGKSLPSEPQWHRAALGTPDGRERRYPWGDDPPSPARGNFDFDSWFPTEVGSHPAGGSAFGVHEMVGNGWEWTSTLFEPLPGFEPFPFYPGYSADFFDGRHYVMKGGSARTAASLLRPSFRNWFQPHYPFAYATFRCVEN
ncbi:MAG: ergothioneine biosynthesis protein EgtB [Acidobacteria bacterium]|nr:ergothioneine biosynthesis protein EgtB [Acidobacteriota bacterium]